MKNNSLNFLTGLIKALITLTAVVILAACGSAAVEPPEPELPQPTATATVPPTPEPTPTSTPAVLEGMLFFDMNGSGLRDEASFQYDSTRLADERQPLQADLLAVINIYLAEHPDIKDGDLVTLEEPGLTGYTVCAGSNCVTTDDEGSFQLVEQDVDRSLDIKIEDPNAGTPALEMRYVNKWKRAVTVPEYTKDVDAATMAQLKVVPECATDASALVCKQDEDTLLVREQHLNDTSIVELADGVEILPGKSNEIGLMQGTYIGPFFSDVIEDIYIWGYFDVLHSPNVCGSEGGINPDGRYLNYNGSIDTSCGFDPINPTVCVGDGHLGYDFRSPVGTITINAGPIALVSFSATRTDGENFVILNYNLLSKQYASYYGHLSTILVEKNTELLTGQVVGLTGHSGDSPYHQLHWDLAAYINNCTKYLPVFYSEVEGIDPDITKNNYWTTFNIITYGNDY